MFKCAMASLAFAAGAASADTPDYCEQWQAVARIIMEGRQAGVTISEATKFALEAAEGSATPEADRAILKGLVMGAYDAPLADTDRGATVAAIQFGERAYGDCLLATRQD